MREAVYSYFESPMSKKYLKVNAVTIFFFNHKA